MKRNATTGLIALALGTVTMAAAHAGPMQMTTYNTGGGTGWVELRAGLGEAIAPNCIYRYLEGKQVQPGGSPWVTVDRIARVFMGPSDVLQTDCFVTQPTAGK